MMLNVRAAVIAGLEYPRRLAPSRTLALVKGSVVVSGGTAGRKNQEFRKKERSFLGHPGFAQAGEKSGFEQGADLRHTPISG
jgi:hypothetical protein